MSQETLRAAIIGTGKMSRGHARGYESAAGTELVACADVNEAAGNRFASEFGISRTYADAREMLEQEKPDLVSICTWPPLHAELTVLACEAGARAVLCEKPMAVDLAAADRMLAAANAHGTLLCINHQRRFRPRYVHAKRYLEAGSIGDVTHVTAICRGDLLTDGTHLIDMTRFLLGDPSIEWVFGSIDLTRRQNVDVVNGMGFAEWLKSGTRYGHHVEGGSLAVLHFQNGVHANLEVGSIALPGYQKFIVNGTNGRIEISGDRPEPSEAELRICPFSGQPFIPDLEPDRSMQANVEEIVACLQTGQTHRLAGISGRATLEAIMAIFASSLERRLIKIPYTRTDSPFEDALAKGLISLA